MTHRIKSLALLVSGVVLGCGAAATVKSSWAGPQPGSWTCYKADGFPNVVVDDGATSGMNAVAKSAPTGTVATYQLSNYPRVCVRD